LLGHGSIGLLVGGPFQARLRASISAHISQQALPTNRRTQTSSLPLLRASTATLLRPLAAAARPVPFSSAAAVRPSSDDELLRVIKSEIKFAEDCDDQDRAAFRRILTAPQSSSLVLLFRSVPGFHTCSFSQMFPEGANSQRYPWGLARSRRIGNGRNLGISLLWS
jgi:hypothetical protein